MTAPTAPRVFIEDVFSLNKGEIVVRYPTSMSQDEFEDAEELLQLIIRKMQRSAASESKK
jgi:hypothetical protein